MEIQLKEKQLQILAKIQSEKQALQVEFNKVISREQETLVLIVEGAGHNSDELLGSKAEIKEGGILVIQPADK